MIDGDIDNVDFICGTISTFDGKNELTVVLSKHTNIYIYIYGWMVVFP